MGERLRAQNRVGRAKGEKRQIESRNLKWTKGFKKGTNQTTWTNLSIFAPERARAFFTGHTRTFTFVPISSKFARSCFNFSSLATTFLIYGFSYRLFCFILRWDLFKWNWFVDWLMIASLFFIFLVSN